MGIKSILKAKSEIWEFACSTANSQKQKPNSTTLRMNSRWAIAHGEVENHQKLRRSLSMNPSLRLRNLTPRQSRRKMRQRRKQKLQRKLHQIRTTSRSG